MKLSVSQVRLDKSDIRFLILYLVSHVVLVYLQGPAADGSFVAELGEYSSGFYRPLVGGDEAVWDLHADWLLESPNKVFDLSGLGAIHSYLLGYIRVADRLTSSSGFVVLLAFLKIFGFSGYTLVLIKSFISFFSFYGLYKLANQINKDFRDHYISCFSSAVLVVMLNPFSLWYINTLLRDDLILLVSSIGLFLFCLRKSVRISSFVYIASLIILLFIAINLRQYLAVMPIVLILFELARYAFRMRLRLSILVSSMVILSATYVGIVYAGRYMSSEFVGTLQGIIASYFRPSPLNVISLTMGEADPIKFVYIINLIVVSSFFMFCLASLILRPMITIRRWFVPLLPLFVVDVLYRYILVSFTGDITGPRQLLALSTLEIFIFVFGIGVHRRRLRVSASR